MIKICWYYIFLQLFYKNVKSFSFEKTVKHFVSPCNKSIYKPGGQSWRIPLSRLPWQPASQTRQNERRRRVKRMRVLISYTGYPYSLISLGQNVIEQKHEIRLIADECNKESELKLITSVFRYYIFQEVYNILECMKKL